MFLSFQFFFTASLRHILHSPYTTKVQFCALKLVYLRSMIKRIIALSEKEALLPHLRHMICICDREAVVVSSYSVTVCPNPLSYTLTISAVMNRSSALYTVPTEICSDLHASSSCTAVKGCFNRHACANTISLTTDALIAWQRI